MKANRGIFATTIEMLLAIVAAAFFVSLVRSEPPEVCKCGVACECSGYSTVAITDRVTPAKVCAITDRPPAKPSYIAGTKTVKAFPPTVRQSLTVRAPVGHTHTCRNGHTWDHSVTTSHNCPICGAYQNVQDRSPRPVTVTRTVVANAALQPAQPAPRPLQTTPVFFLPRASAGGCANGQCAIAR